MGDATDHTDDASVCVLVHCMLRFLKAIVNLIDFQHLVTSLFYSFLIRT